MQGITEQVSALGLDLFRQAIINGGCQVAQRPTATLSTTYQYGAVDRLKVRATGTVSGGTIIQDTAALVGTSGNALRISNVTVSGGSLIVLYHIESAHAVAFKNLIGSFACKIKSDMPGTINYSIAINTPTTTADDYSAQTSVYSGGNIAVTGSTVTTLKAENISLGDVSKGMQIVITIACGATSVNSFWLTELQFNKGPMAGTFMPRPYDLELVQCKRYYQTFTEPHMIGATQGGTAVARLGMMLPVTMRIAPTVSFGALPIFDSTATTTLASVVTGYHSPTRIQADVTTAGALTGARPAITYKNTDTVKTTCEADI